MQYNIYLEEQPVLDDDVADDVDGRLPAAAVTNSDAAAVTDSDSGGGDVGVAAARGEMCV